MKKDTRILLIPIIILATALLVLGSVLLSMIIKERRDTSLDTQTLQEMRDKCNNDLYDLRYNLEIADIRDIGREENVVSVYRYTRNGAFEGISIIEFREYTDGTGNIAYIRYNSNSFIIVNGIFENVSFDLTVEETRSFLQCIEEHNFNKTPTIHPYDTNDLTDGVYQYLEGENCSISEKYDCAFSNYHLLFLRNSNLDHPAFNNIVDKMIELLESKGCQVRFNVIQEEEELRKSNGTE